MVKHHNLNQLALAPQHCPALLVCSKPLIRGLQDLGSSEDIVTSRVPPSLWDRGMVSCQWASRRLPSCCGGWYGFPQLLKLLIAALGSSTRAFHSCSPCGLLQHGFLVEQMVHYVESYCIFVSLIFIYLFRCLSFLFLFFFKWAYSFSAELGIGIGIGCAFDILIFIFVYMCSILHWVVCALWSYSEQIFVIWIEISSWYCKGKKAYERRSLKAKVNVFLSFVLSGVQFRF